MKIFAKLFYIGITILILFIFIMLYVFLKVIFYCRGEQMDSQFWSKREIFACGQRMNWEKWFRQNLWVISY